MKKAELIVLGTSSQFPTKNRNHSSVFLRFDKFKALFDCGEGTQRQMRILKFSPHHLNALFISHWHGDHTLGIGGILQSLSASNREEELNIYGPIGTKDRINHIMNTYYFKKTFKVNVFEFNPKSETTVLDNNEFFVNCFPLKHGIPCIGFSFNIKPVRKINIEYTKKYGLTKHPLLGKLQKGEDIIFEGKTITAKKGTYLEEGKKISYIVDTLYDESLVNFAKNSDLLICEATLLSTDSEDSDFKHMSSKEAAILAKKAKCKELLLTHISQRYYDSKPLEDEAKKLFKKTKFAKDFDKIIV